MPLTQFELPLRSLRLSAAWSGHSGESATLTHPTNLKPKPSPIIDPSTGQRPFSEFGNLSSQRQSQTHTLWFTSNEWFKDSVADSICDSWSVIKHIDLNLSVQQ